MTTTTITQTEQQPLGAALPPFTAHAISVSLPTWRDNVGYEEGEKRVVDAMVSGYPRFFIHLSIQKLAKICEQKFGVPGESCLLCPTRRVAELCREFMLDRSTKAGSPVPVRLVQFTICPEDDDASSPCVELHIVLFPKDSFPLAKQFWQHTGLCVSSRLAERCLVMMKVDGPGSAIPKSPTAPFMKPGNRHYSAAKGVNKSPPSSPAGAQPRFNGGPEPSNELLSKDHFNYVEERYGRNMPLESAAAAKRALRRRIAGVLVRDTPSDWSTAGGHDTELGPSTRAEGVTESDVFLYSTGMAAIWSAHQLALGARPAAKSVCFGFPYTDTLKILEKWGPGCHFLGRGLDADIDELETILERESKTSSSGPPVLSLFTEFPSNPLLRSADLPRLRALADKHDFLIVVDETLGNFVNVEVLPYADVVVSSLSKIFSGDANVMGGSLVLNPNGRHYAALKAHMAATYEDSYYGEDAVYMERNSRDFRQRIHAIDANALAVCDRAFFDDALPCMKGPSLGTNFTLACPYTILAHYAELDWAAGWGVEAGLVRVSVGLEERAALLRGFGAALEAAEAAVLKEQEEAKREKAEEAEA
uniref:STE/STE11/CDC15 protein kinase n=1 Tax=Ganoderma boninense TaxID=34458 RepID=A0A5K1K338_9APHY|nr:STE/STE11/CDC15 protein kinase [Ganoderma boninense]